MNFFPVNFTTIDFCSLSRFTGSGTKPEDTNKAAEMWSMAAEHGQSVFFLKLCAGPFRISDSLLPDLAFAIFSAG